MKFDPDDPLLRIPDFLRIPQEERRKWWKEHPPRPMPKLGKADKGKQPVTAGDAHDEAVRRELLAADNAKRKQATKERLAKLKESKMAKSKTAKSKARKAPSAKSSKPDKPKVQIVADLLRRPSGCTTADVLAATGWPSVSMPQQAKAAGLNLRQEKEGRTTRYFAA